MLSIDQLLTPLTREQVKAKLYELAASLGLPTTAWFSGAPTRTLITILSEIYGGFIAPLITTIAKSGFLDEAESGWLTLLAASVYDVDRKVATFATGEVTLDNAGGGIYTFDVSEALFKNSSTDEAYTNTESFTLGSLVTGLAVAVRAVNIGSVGNATAGQIDSIITTMPDVTVTNAGDLVGQDAESDAELRQRCRDKLGALSPDGPAAAFRYVAVTPELNGGANVNRVKVMPSEGTNTIDVILASPDGVPTGPDVALVQAGFDTWATPDTIVVTAVAATEQVWTVETNVTVDAAAGLTNAEWQEVIKAALVAWIRAFPIGGIELTPGVGVIPYRSAIGVIERARQGDNDPYSVLHASLTSEANVSVAAVNVVTLDEGDVTVNVTQVSLV